MTSRVRATGVNCGRIGAISTPASAASIEPSTQATLDTRFGSTPFSAPSSRLSTTARIATPIRVL